MCFFSRKYGSFTHSLHPSRCRISFSGLNPSVVGPLDTISQQTNRFGACTGICAHTHTHTHTHTPTSQGGKGAETRIDGVPTEPRVASLVHDDRVVRKLGLPGHLLLQVDIDLSMACQQVTKIRRLEEPLKHNMQLTEHRALARAFLDSVRRPWAMAICQEDIDAMWCTWTWAAEEFLLRKLDEDGTAASVMRSQWPGPPVLKVTKPEMNERGRGATHTTTVTNLCRNKKLPSGAPKMRVIKLMDAIRGSLKPVLRYVHQRETSEEIRPGKWPTEVQRC